MRRAAELIGWGTPVPPGRGRGIAVGIKSGPTTGLSYSTVRLLADGSVIVYAGTSDMGQGARTVFAQIAGQELGAPLDAVTVVMGDTAVVPYDQQTSASRSTVLMGNAVLAACRDIQAKLRAMAARLHGVDEAAIVVDRGVVRLPDRELSILDVLRPGLGRLGGELVGNGEMRKDAEPDHPLGGSAGVLRVQLHGRRGRGRRGDRRRHARPPRHRVGRRQGHQPAPGPDAGRGCGDPGPRPHPDGALHLRRGAAGSGTSARSTTGSRRAWTCRSRCTARSSRTRTGPGPYGSKGMSEGALLCVAAAVAGGRARRDRRRHPRPAADAGARLAGARGSDRERATAGGPHDERASGHRSRSGGSRPSRSSAPPASSARGG